jgi:hypothetical protein
MSIYRWPIYTRTEPVCQAPVNRGRADGRWEILACPWPSIDMNDRRSAAETTRLAVAEWLGVSLDAFDVEAD